jgi:hypothetical protein
MADPESVEPEEPYEEPSRDDSVVGDDGALRPDHPLLARAQAALKKQLEDSRLRLQEELREKNIQLNVSVRVPGSYPAFPCTRLL